MPRAGHPRPADPVASPRRIERMIDPVRASIADPDAPGGGTDVLDRELDLYDHHVEISFVKRIRGMVAYSGVEPLIAQIAADVAEARRILTAAE